MATPHISDPWAAVQIVIDSSKSNKQRVCAGLDVAYFAADTFVPDAHPMVGASEHAAKSEEALVAELKECYPPKKGVGASPTEFPWTVVVPLVLALLKKWIPWLSV